MKIRVLGAHNLESRTTRHTCFLVDDVLAVDAGSLASALTPAEHKRVEAILLTHMHFDHTRDIPSMALATLYEPRPIQVFSLKETLDAVHDHLIDGRFYPDFTRDLGPIPPRYRFHALEPRKPVPVLGYQVKAFPMTHPVPSVGYLVRSRSGACFGYSGDTYGDLLPLVQDEWRPRVLFVEMTYPTREADLAKLTGHLTPALLRAQLAGAVEARTVMPQVIAVHIGFADRDQIIRELADVAKDLRIDLTAGREDMVVTI